MNDYQIYFAHGKESGPWGTKIKAMAKVADKHGFAYVSPDYSEIEDPNKRIEKLVNLKPQAGKKLVIVGSSMGGYVSSNASEVINPDLLFLLAPALYIPGYPNEPKAKADRMIVIHGIHDDIVPVSSAYRFAQEFNSELHILDSAHTLKDQLPFIEYVFEQALIQLKQ